MKIHCLLTITALLLAVTATAANIPVHGAGQSVSLKDIEGTPTLITVNFRDSGAHDANLQLLEVHADRIIVLTSRGEIIPYLADNIESVTVQDGTVERRRLPEIDAQVLRSEHQRVVDRAWARIQEIYTIAVMNQQLRIKAAVCLTLANHTEAHNYLRQLAESNDIITQLEAAGALYLAGDSVSDTLLRQGLDSGNRNARAMAASLAGLTEFEDGIEQINVLFQDRAVQLSAPATRAMARLEQRHAVPRIMTMLTELHADKGDAAVFALTKLAQLDDERDEHLVEQLKYRLLDTDGMIRFRIVRILHKLGDPLGDEELKNIFNNFPTLTPEVALLLAEHGDWDATQYLRNRLSRREDPTVPNLQYRARNAKALLAGGDPSAMAVFQELLRSDDPEIYNFVFEQMAELENPRLITLLQPGVETIDIEYAFGASQTVIALAHSDFRERLLRYREEFDY